MVPPTRSQAAATLSACLLRPRLTATSPPLVSPRHRRPALFQQTPARLLAQRPGALGLPAHGPSLPASARVVAAASASRSPPTSPSMHHATTSRHSSPAPVLAHLGSRLYARSFSLDLWMTAFLLVAALGFRGDAAQAASTSSRSPRRGCRGSGRRPRPSHQAPDRPGRPAPRPFLSCSPPHQSLELPFSAWRMRFEITALRVACRDAPHACPGASP